MRLACSGVDISEVPGEGCCVQCYGKLEEHHQPNGPGDSDSDSMTVESSFAHVVSFTNIFCHFLEYDQIR